VSGRTLSLVSGLGGALILLWCVLALPRAVIPSSEPSSVIISEIAWSGTVAGPRHEWLELHNYGDRPVDLTDWSLRDDGLLATLKGVLLPNAFYILERDEFALIDVVADCPLNGLLEDSGEAILLLDASGSTVDSANIAGGPWPAGTGDPDFRSMERAQPLSSDEPANWINNDGVTRNGLAADGRPVNGTPGMPNSAWLTPPPVDLALQKKGPYEVTAGQTLEYVLAISNTGQITVANVIVTDTLPPAAHFLDHDGQFPLAIPLSNTLVWHVGALDPGALISIRLTTSVAPTFTGLLTNSARVGSPELETVTQNNHDVSVTEVSLPQAIMLIDAVYYDGYEPQDSDEGVRLINVGGSTQDLSGWRLSDGLYEAIFPPGLLLKPGEGVWLADQAASFRRQFGHNPQFEVRGSDPTVPNLEGTWPGFSNTGDEVLLISAEGTIVDVLVYEAGDATQTGWSGPALQPYTLSGVFAAEGQILSRSPDAASRSRVPDTDSAIDWVQSLHDPVNARQVRYPGWDYEHFFPAGWFTETAEMVIGIAPDNAFDMLQAELARAQSHLLIASHTFRSSALKQELIAALNRGVSVTVLLEGDPVGGIDPTQHDICQELESAGGQCWLMINDPDQDIYDRYRYLHAKYIIIDGSRAVISTENLSPDSLPDDDKTDGTAGRRGVIVATDAQSVVGQLQALWDEDFDPLNHRDLAPWPAAETTSGSIQSANTTLNVTQEVTYSVRYTEPFQVHGQLPVAVVLSPENALGRDSGLLHLLAQAGTGDTLLIEQLSERPHWGATGSDPVQDPNPRLEALFDAARRGAKVRLLLDEFFDSTSSPVSNVATCQYANHTAEVERLDLSCRQANPTGLGLHNKMILAQINDRGYVFVGSLNGTELSSKGNREVALLMQSNVIYALLADMFTRDWPRTVSLPLVYKDYSGPAQHILISEIFYDPPGVDDAEFIELFNPTYWPLDISGYSVGDAVNRDDFEDVRLFPYGTIVEAGTPVVIASTSTGFYGQFGFRPDFEIFDSDPLVPDLQDDLGWGDPAAILQLANGGDEVIVRDPSGSIVEALAYGSGSLPGNAACPLNTLAGSVLERYPPWRDTDNCPADFREWPYPNPGQVP
jgi:uncharacterized repeat protein (TIGR01451 family)